MRDQIYRQQERLELLKTEIQSRVGQEMDGRLRDVESLRREIEASRELIPKAEELAKKHDANYLLRGLRNTTDFEYENSIAQVNKYLNSDLESVFLITSPEYAAINSSIIREVHKYNGDINVFLPYEL